MSTEYLSPVISLPMDDEDKANCKKRVERLRHTNSVLLNELANRGGAVDFQVGMIHTMFEGLVEIGALREDQWLAIQLIWEERFNGQLTHMKGQLEEAIRTARNQARLITPPGSKNGHQQLIIPGS